MLLPLVLGLIGAASCWPIRTRYAREPASKVWGVIHGDVARAGHRGRAAGFAAGVAYLGQRWRLKHKIPPLARLRLPSLEWLQRANSHAILAAAFMLGVGIVSGMILNAIRGTARPSGCPWSDPVVLSTTAMFAWLLVAVVVGHLYAPAGAAAGSPT